MAPTPYILPREKRESAILVGNGTVGPFGPSLYKIFDTADVAVFAKALGETVYTDVTAGCTIAKVNPAAAYDYFTVTFGAAVPATTSWYHQARRTAERSVAVTKAGTINSLELEKELSKQASAQSELRRDVDRAVRVNAGDEPMTIIPGADGELPKFENGNVVPSGENVDSINGATAAAVAARDAARKWATEAEDVAVNDGVNPAGFSAYHWMRKALGYAGAAAASAVAAAASAASINLPPVVANTFLQAKADASGYQTKTSTEVRNALAAASFVIDRAAVKALDPTKDKAATTYGEGLGRNGTWVAFLTASLSAIDQAAAADDTQQGLFFQSTANPLYTWVRQCRRQADIDMFGASTVATAAANSTAIQAAIDLCQKYSIPLRIPAGDYSYDTTLTIKNVLRLTGDGMFRSKLLYTGAFSGMFVNPDATFSNDNTGYYFADFYIAPSVQYGGTYGIICSVAGTEFISNSMFERIYVGQFGTRGFYFNNTGTTGGFFSLHINRAFIANGFKGNNVGDSVLITSTTINAQGNYMGIELSQMSGAREFTVWDCNITCQGGGIQLINTVGVKILKTWIEHPSYWGDALGALTGQLQLTGASKTVVRDCTIQPLSTSVVSTAYAVVVGVNSNDNVFEDNEFGIGETDYFSIATGALRNQIRDGNSDILGGTLTFADNEPTTIYGPKLQARTGKAIGYAAGAGGAVVQATSKSTLVTLHKASGQITMNAAALAAGTVVSFVLSNSAIAAGDVLILNHISGGTFGAYSLNARSTAAGATIDVRNNTAGSLSEAIVIAFAVLKAVTT